MGVRARAGVGAGLPATPARTPRSECPGAARATTLAPSPTHPLTPPLSFIHHCSEARYGKLLAPYLDDPASLFIISSDFCHWGRRFSYTFYDKSKARARACACAVATRAHTQSGQLAARCLGATAPPRAHAAGRPPHTLAPLTPPHPPRAPSGSPYGGWTSRPLRR